MTPSLLGNRPTYLERRALAAAALVAVALLLLAWLPRSGLLDPPAGQSEGPRPVRPTTVPGDDD